MIKKALVFIFGLFAIVSTTLSEASALHIDSIYVFTRPELGDSVSIYAVLKIHFGNGCMLQGYATSIKQDTIGIKVCYSVDNTLVVCSRLDTIALGDFSPRDYHVQIVISQTPSTTCIDGGDTVDISVTSQTSTIGQADFNEIGLYPNPTGDNLFLNLREGLSPVYLKVITLEGKILIERTLNGGSNFNTDVSSISHGIYLLSVQTAKDCWIGKFVKQ